MGLTLLAAAAALLLALRTAEVSQQGSSRPFRHEIPFGLGESGPGNARSSPEAFLDDLDERASALEGARDPRASVSVVWEDASGLQAAASSAVRAYRDEGSCRLVANGYLDLKGNVWAALIQGGDGWVDLVLATEGEGGGGGARMKVTRLLSG